MATCKECFHYQACKGTYYEVKEQGEFDGEMYAECKCDDFLPAADFVEVVRCKDCKFRYTPFRCALHNGRFNGNDYFIEHGEDFYCSSGERRDTM